MNPIPELDNVTPAHFPESLSVLVQLKLPETVYIGRNFTGTEKRITLFAPAFNKNDMDVTPLHLKAETDTPSAPSVSVTSKASYSELLYYKALSNDCAGAIFPSLSAPKTCLKSDRLRPLKKAFYTVIYAYFRWEALTLSWETVQYSIVVSSFSCPRNSLTSSIFIPLANKSVAIVRRNRWGCTFSTSDRFPSWRSMYWIPATVRRLWG